MRYALFAIVLVSLFARAEEELEKYPIARHLIPRIHANIRALTAEEKRSNVTSEHKHDSPIKTEVDAARAMEAHKAKEHANEDWVWSKTAKYKEIYFIEGRNSIHSTRVAVIFCVEGEKETRAIVVK